MTTVVEALRGDVAEGSTVVVKGWIRTRRDSKAGGGLSFITVHDGSCFDPIQVVARATLANFETEVARLTFDAVESGQPEVLADDRTRTVKANLSRDHDLIYPAIQKFWDDAIKGTG